MSTGLSTCSGAVNPLSAAPSPPLSSLLSAKVQPTKGRLCLSSVNNVSVQPRSTGICPCAVSLVFFTLQPSGGQQKLQEELKWVQEHHRVRQQALETQV